MAMRFLVGAGLVASALAQVQSYTNNGNSLTVNVPSDTASSGSGPIYLQLGCASTNEWCGWGQGSQMKGANMIIMYTASSSNVTVSPRIGTGEVMPSFNSDAKITVLEGSGLDSSGNMIANVRCDSCNSWSGGSMSVTDSSSSWIAAFKQGDAMATTDQSASISQHDFGANTGFTIDLTKASGGDSTNPFIAQSSSSPSSAASSSAGSAPSSTGASSPSAASTSSSSSATQSVSVPLASQSPNSGNPGSTHTIVDPTVAWRKTHAILMSLLFLVFFPLFALTIYLPGKIKVRYIHAPLQIISVILLIVGLAYGVKLANALGETSGYHQVLGYVIVAFMIGVQPVMGVVQHLQYHSNKGQSAFGVLHRWLGRTFIILGVVNGGLGFLQAGPIGSSDVPHGAVYGYIIVAIIVLFVYIAVAVFANLAKKRRPTTVDGEKAWSNQGYEMHPSTGRDGPAQRIPGRR